MGTLEHIAQQPVKITVTEYLDSHEIKGVDPRGIVWLIDPFVSCAVETSDDFYEEEGRALVGKTYRMSDYFLCGGRPDGLPAIWVPSKFEEIGQ